MLIIVLILKSQPLQKFLLLIETFHSITFLILISKFNIPNLLILMKMILMCLLEKQLSSSSVFHTFRVYKFEYEALERPQIYLKLSSLGVIYVWKSRKEILCHLIEFFWGFGWQDSWDFWLKIPILGVWYFTLRNFFSHYPKNEKFSP